MPFDPLFLALAQAKSMPSHGFRAFQSAMDIPGQAIKGLSEGYQLKRMVEQPEAMARIYAATPQGAEILKNTSPDALVSAMIGMDNNKLFGETLPRQAQIANQRELGLKSIDERNTASQRAYDASMARTGAERDIFGGKNISSNIAMHENELQKLMAENGQLATKIPGGVSGTIKNWLTNGGVAPDILKDPQVAAIAAQMKSNMQRIQAHQAALVPMYKAQGMVPNELLKSMGGADLNAINPGGDTSIPGQEVIPGVSAF